MGRKKTRRLLRIGRRTFRHVQVGAPPGTLRADHEALRPRITVIAYGPDELTEREIERPEELEDLAGRQPVSWVNIDGLGDIDVLQTIGRIFGLHPLALEDVVNVFQRAKLEHFGEHLFFVGRMVQRKDHLESEQVSLFLGDDFLLSFQERPGDCFEPVRHRLRSGRETIRSKGPDYLAYALVDALIDNFFPVLETYGELLGNLEDEVLGRPHPDTAQRIQEAKRDLLNLRRAAWPHREAVSQLWRDDTPLIEQGTRLYLRDCYDHVVQLMDLVENYREMGSGLMDLHLSMISNRMNDVMKVLTIIATVFIPLGFIAGVYGMNFDPEVSAWNMPELGWAWGYPYVLGLMAAVSATMVWYFYRKGWIGSPPQPDPYPTGPTEDEQSTRAPGAAGGLEGKPMTSEPDRRHDRGDAGDDEPAG